MTSIPSFEPMRVPSPCYVCNLGLLPKGLKPAELRRLRSEENGLEERVSEERNVDGYNDFSSSPEDFEALFSEHWKSPEVQLKCHACIAI